MLLVARLASRPCRGDRLQGPRGQQRLQRNNQCSSAMMLARMQINHPHLRANRSPRSPLCQPFPSKVLSLLQSIASSGARADASNAARTSQPAPGKPADHAVHQCVEVVAELPEARASNRRGEAARRRRGRGPRGASSGTAPALRGIGGLDPSHPFKHLPSRPAVQRRQARSRS